MEVNDHNYKLKIEGFNSKGNQIKYEHAFSVTKFFDELGYLHRYKVRDIFEECFNKFVTIR